MGEQRAKSLGLLQLLSDPNQLNLGEIMWRIGLPVVALLVSLLAIPLAYVNPRVGRSFNLIVAVLLFAFYLNVLNTVQAYVQQGRLDFNVGVWVVHALFLSLVVVLFARRVYLQRWLPRWLRSSKPKSADAA
jgi:lipopolysaccharide export system permease protein